MPCRAVSCHAVVVAVAVAIPLPLPWHGMTWRGVAWHGMAWHTWQGVPQQAMATCHVRCAMCH
eukprot:5767488-Lingulodinium_polyedra.AAC.1